MYDMRDVFQLPVNAGVFEVSGYISVNGNTLAERLEADEYAAYAINHVDSLADALVDCLLQIEYLQGKFKETGSGNSVLSRGQAVLLAYRGKQ